MNQFQALWNDCGFRRKLSLVLALVVAIVATAMVLALFQQRVTERNVQAAQSTVDRMREVVRLEEALGRLKEDAFWYGAATPGERADRRDALLNSLEEVQVQARRIRPEGKVQRASAARMRTGATNAVGEFVKSSTVKDRQLATAVFFNDLAFNVSKPASELTQGIVSQLRRDHVTFSNEARRGLRMIVNSLIAATLVIALIAALIPGSIVKRLERLREAVHRIALGSTSLQVEISGNDEVGRLARDFNAMAVSLQMREAENRRLLEEQRELATRDGLTGLRNRRFFMEQVDSLLALAARQEVPVSLAILDIDNFKLINDEHGHVAGDAVLVRVADVLVDQLRIEDIPCRIGGEEFGVLFVGSSDRDAVRALERVADALAQPVDGVLGMTFSAGIAAVRPDETGEDLYARSDDAAYHSKRTGKNRITVADDMASGEQAA